MPGRRQEPLAARDRAKMVGVGVIMSKTEEFIASLHAIAAGDDSVDRQKDAVRKVQRAHGSTIGPI